MTADFVEMINGVNESLQYGFTDTENGCYIFIDNGSRITYLDIPAIAFYAMLDNEKPENGKVNVYRITYTEKEPDAETDTEKFGLEWYPDAIDIVGAVNVSDLKRV